MDDQTKYGRTHTLDEKTLTAAIPYFAVCAPRDSVLPSREGRFIGWLSRWHYRGAPNNKNTHHQTYSYNKKKIALVALTRNTCSSTVHRRSTKDKGNGTKQHLTYEQHTAALQHTSSSWYIQTVQDVPYPKPYTTDSRTTINNNTTVVGAHSKYSLCARCPSPQTLSQPQLQPQPLQRSPPHPRPCLPISR